jgi:hypothetical protein
MITLALNVRRIPEGIARLAGEYHSCELVSFRKVGLSDGSKALFCCPSREAANAVVVTLFNSDDDEVEYRIVESAPGERRCEL